MSRFGAPPHLIESEIEMFLDNFKYMTSLLDHRDSDLSLLDCRLGGENAPRFRFSTSSSEGGDYSSLISTSVSGPKHSVTSPSDNRFSSLTSSMISTDVASFEFEQDPPPSLASFRDDSNSDLLSTGIE